MIKKIILPVVLAIIAYFTAPIISPEIEGAATFFLVAVGLGLGIMANQFIFTNKNKSDSKN